MKRLHHRKVVQAHKALIATLLITIFAVGIVFGLNVAPLTIATLGSLVWLYMRELVLQATTRLHWSTTKQTRRKILFNTKGLLALIFASNLVYGASLAGYLMIASTLIWLFLDEECEWLTLHFKEISKVTLFVNIKALIMVLNGSQIFLANFELVSILGFIANALWLYDIELTTLDK